MTTILAIDTATDACSVALYRDGSYKEIHEVIPRQHSQRLLPMLRELLPDGNLSAQGVDAIAYGCGPGSFTGLRIAASAVQGLAFANALPAIPISTLACQAQTALRCGLINPDAQVLSLLDAQINEVYWSLYRVEDNLVHAQAGPEVSQPADLQIPTANEMIQAVGSGLRYCREFPASLSERINIVSSDVLPMARDLVPLALEKFLQGEMQRPEEVAPVYVREEISWKKLAEQGKHQ